MRARDIIKHLGFSLFKAHNLTRYTNSSKSTWLLLGAESELLELSFDSQYHKIRRFQSDSYSKTLRELNTMIDSMENKTEFALFDHWHKDESIFSNQSKAARSYLEENKRIRLIPMWRYSDHGRLFSIIEQ